MATDGSTAKDSVRLFTDGACSGNPGPGGWAYILQHTSSGQTRDAWGAEPLTTNNKMELTAGVRGLSVLKKRSHVELFTDSVYVGKGMSEWLPKWKAMSVVPITPFTWGRPRIVSM